MQIHFLNPKGAMPSEATGIAEMRARLPRGWKGFANFNMRNPSKRGQDREIDVAIITPDRIILVDLKNHRGKIESRAGTWYADGKDIGPSAARKIRENAKVMATLVRQQVGEMPGSPPIESAVVFSNPRADLSGLAVDEKERTFRLDDFLKISDPKTFQACFPTGSQFGGARSLNAGQYAKGLDKLFTNGLHIQAREVSYNGFVADGPPEFAHPLYAEYSAYDRSDPNYTALLRLWDFNADLDAFAVEDERKTVASRERRVLGYLSNNDPDLYDNFVLRSRTHDDQYTLRYHEVFDRHGDLTRLSRYAGQVTDLDIDRRLELARIFLDRVASLHRLQVAHRDLGRHSTWVDERRSRVVLSNLGAAHFPDVETLGDLRSKLLAGGSKVPEDVGAGKPGSPYQQDVFLAAATVWTILTGTQLHAEQKVFMWPPDQPNEHEVPAELMPWFARCLSLDAADRMTDGIEAAEEFERALSRNERIHLDRQLDRHRRDVDPLVDYPPAEWIRQKPYRIYRSHPEGGPELLVKSWPGQYVGDIRKSAASLLKFVSKVERLQSMAPAWAPPVEFSCLTMDGLLLVQRWVDGEGLDLATAAAWSDQVLGTFLLALVKGVEELHVHGLAHGDLKPANVLVAIDGDGNPEPVLLDLLDYSPERDGERTTMAYTPPGQGRDALHRDCFAVATMATECARAWTTAHPGEVWGRAIESAAEECGEGEEAWTTLIPLRKLLKIGPREAGAPERLVLSIPVWRQWDAGTMLADNGKFHLVVKLDRRQFEISGFDKQVIVEFDADRRPSSASIKNLTPRGANWAARNSTLSFEGEVRTTSRNSPFNGMENLWRLVDEGLGQIANAIAATEQVEVEVTPAVSGGRPKPSAPFPVAKFWQETIAVEESLKPEIRLAAAPQETGEPDRIRLSAVDSVNWEAFDVESGKAIKLTWNGDLIGIVDTDRSRGNTVIVRGARGYRKLAEGDRLRIHSADDLSSFQRRSRATERILTGQSRIPDLIKYFDPNASLEPVAMGAPVPADALGKYGLNQDQEEAFRHLWQNGPVGLLQGPPGTGKTRFIAAFAHWALNGGRMDNVLILSQSHEAVNNASERVLSVFEELGGDIDLLRVGHYDKISAPLRKYHSQALQDRYRELFRADVKSRLAVAARRLGLQNDYVREAHEVEATFGSLVRQMEYAERDIADETASAELMEVAERRLAGLKRAFDGMLASEVEANAGSPPQILEDLRDETARKHSVYDPDARGRLLGLEALSRSWIGALTHRHRNLEEFLARSRNLVCGTCVGIGRHGLRIDRGMFDLVIIDEAARCMPSELAVGMQSGRRVLLVGDHRQLPPLFGHEVLRGLSDRLPGFHRGELRRSDFERAFTSTYGRSVARTLKKQYRMAPEIGTLVSDNFYPLEGLETSRPEPHGIYGLLEAPLDKQVRWLDTGRQAGDSLARTSYSNRREAMIIMELLRLFAGSTEFIEQAPAALRLKPGEPMVSVICMYAEQVSLVDELLMTSDIPPQTRSLINVDTVDAYQGKESPIVIVSMVRNNKDSAMGHVASSNRLNVALSRAMDRLVIVGSAEMFGNSNTPVAPVVAWLRAKGRVQTAQSIGLKS